MLRITFAELKRSPARAEEAILKGEAVEITRYNVLWARLVPATQAAVADVAQASFVAAHQPAPAPAPEKPKAPKFRDPEKTAAVASYHGHTGDPLVDLAEMERRARATLPTPKAWPPKKFYDGKFDKVSWFWEEWARLRVAAGLAAPPNMPGPTPPLPVELEVAREEAEERERTQRVARTFAPVPAQVPTPPAPQAYGPDLGKLFE